MNQQLRYLKQWLFIGLLLVVGVIYLSLTPVPQELQIEFQFADKIEHTLAYSILMLWFGQLTLMRFRLLCALLLVLLGIALEYLQGMTAYRQFDIFDMAANTTGVLLGLYLSSYCFNESFGKSFNGSFGKSFNRSFGKSFNGGFGVSFGNCFIRIEQQIKKRQHQ